MPATMSVPARHVLNVAILRADGDLPLDGWEHYATTLADDGRGVFLYDREDGSTLAVVTGGENGHEIDWARSTFSADDDAQAPPAPCGYCRRCAIHDDPAGCLTVEAWERENPAAAARAIAAARKH